MKKTIILFALLFVAITVQNGFAQTQKQFVLQTAKALSYLAARQRDGQNAKRGDGLADPDRRREFDRLRW